MKYSLEKTQEICDYIHSGLNNLDACTLADISESTFYQWQKEYMEFSESIKKAKIKRKKELLYIIFNASNKTWQASAWYLERVYPDEFGRKKIQENNTNETLINLIQSLTSE